ncbi:MAG: beta-hydroxyacyl-ACP dehydratase [Pirellulaceae bacterium]|nr:beta-hydroxyacyl-ACP dehydratase [Pirellulaceae bacterium]
MRFRQIHRISLLEPGQKIEATCVLTGREDYLRDHFPRFAVMPGVMMLESLFQASALLVRATDGYNMGLVLLQEAKNVKFSDFVQPGQSLNVVSEIIKHGDETTLVKATGRKTDAVAVTARLLLKRGFIEGGTQLSYADRYASNYMRDLTQQLMQVPMGEEFAQTNQFICRKD